MGASTYKRRHLWAVPRGSSRACEGHKIALRSFSIRWTTSPLRTFVQVELRDWRHANRAIAVMSQIAPVSGMGVHRVWFRLAWQDGERHQARVDLVRRPLADVTVLSRHVRDTLAFQAGRRRPANIPLPDYLAAVREMGELVRRRAERLLDGYDLGLEDETFW